MFLKAICVSSRKLGLFESASQDSSLVVYSWEGAVFRDFCSLSCSLLSSVSLPTEWVVMPLPRTVHLFLRTVHLPFNSLYLKELPSKLESFSFRGNFYTTVVYVSVQATSSFEGLFRDGALPGS